VVGVEIKDMADILLKGGKMLGRSCPECNAPLFQQEGRTFCARCNWQEGGTPGKKPAAKGKATTEPEAPAKGPEEPREPGEAQETLEQLQKAILVRIAEYAGKIADKDQSANLKANLEILSELVEVLEKSARAKRGGSND
jgi:UPF0148 protein